MPGHHGYKKRTSRNLQVYKIDYPNSLLYVKGSIPGARLESPLKIFDSFFAH